MKIIKYFLGILLLFMAVKTKIEHDRGKYRETSGHFVEKIAGADLYVHKLSKNMSMPHGVVKAYGTQECIHGPIRILQSELGSKNFSYRIVDLNKNAAESDAFQEILRSLNLQSFNLPAYVVGDYIIFNNEDVASQIRALSEL